jgi:hypothetical protein
MTPTDATAALVSADAQLAAMRLVQVHIADEAGEYEKRMITEMLNIFTRRVERLENISAGRVDAAIERAERALRVWREGRV